LFVLMGGVVIAGCGNSSNSPTDASYPADTSSPRDTVGPAVDASSPDTNRAQAATPAFAPAGGVYSDPQLITITSSSVSAQIHYTLDGTEPTAASPVYTVPISVSVTTTIKAINIDPTGTLLNSSLASATYTLAARVPPPTFSIPSGTYGSTQLVTVTDSNPNATIRYTVDGSDPIATSTVYTMPISVSATMTIKAIATLAGMVDSLVSSAQYTIQTLVPAATPTFSPAAGTYAGAQDVTIATTTASAQIYYSLDGTDPTQASTLYSTPVHIANSMVLKARAYATGMAPSAIASAAYSISAPVAAKPTISPNGGTFTAAQQVTLSTTETDGRIIYTTDGSIPNTTSGNIYTAPFTLAQTATVNAIVVNVTGKDPSPLATAVFTINIALPIAFDKQTGTYNNDLSVAITSSATGATVCYTKDASDPACSATGTCASGQSTAGVPVVITGNASATGTTVRARACKAGLPAGPVVEQIYTMVAASVVFSPAGSTVAIGTAVSMSSVTTGAEIRYRDDSTDPTCTTGTVYTAAIALSQSKQFRAIACKANYTASAVSNASYGVKLTTPIALQLDSGNQYVTVGATATTADSIDDLVFALGLPTAAVTNQTLCYSVNGTAPACTTSGTCNTSVAGLFSRTLQATADPIHGKLSNIVGDSATAVTIAAPADGSATLAVKAAFCAPNYAISDVSTVTYTFKAATPTLSRATGTTTLAGENANDTIATTTTGARLRYYRVASGATPPTLSCTGAVPTGVTEVNGITTTIQVNGGDSVAAIACRTNYNPSDTVTANYPLPGTTAAPAFSTQGTTLFRNDLAAGLIKITDSDIADVGDTVVHPAGVVCWTTADTGTVNCNEHATAPTCVTPPSPGGTYTWNSSVSPAVSNLPAVAGSGVRLRAIACAPGKAKSAITSQTFNFQVADPTITPPAQATSTTIGIGEVLTFSSTTTGANFRYIKGTSNAAPANPTCATGTAASSYTVTAGDASNGSLIVKVIACKNQYTASGVTTSNTYTSFRGAAAVFGIPAGTYGDVLEASSSNTLSGLQSVSVPNTTGLVRICVTKNGVVPVCTADNHCDGQGAATAADIIGGANGIASGDTLPWSTFDTSGLTLRAEACYTSLADPPVTVSGPYNFQVAPLTITNTTPAPNPPPFSKTQRIVFRVGNEAATGVDAVKAPSPLTATGPVQLCYTTDGSALGTGCSSTGSMTCTAMTIAAASVSATYTLDIDSTQAFTAKACKSTMTPSTASSTVTIPPYARTLNMSGGNDFVGHASAEGFATMATTTHFFTSWDATYLYLGWQGCGLNTTNTVDTNNFALAYLGVPGQQGTTIGSAFPAVNGGARWQLKYDVGGDTAQIRIRNFSGSGSWETVASAGLTSVHGAGNSAACTDTADNTGDYVIVRIPRATLATATVIPKQIAIAEGINIGIPAQPDNADAAGWPFTTAVFDAPAAIFDFTIWQPPTGAAGCDTSGIDGTPVCQFAP
jgi:hypothetical protein